MACYVYVVSHIVYQMTGNLLVPIWLAYIFSAEQFWRRKDYHESNLDQASEKAFRADKRFILPVYTFVYFDTLNWLWCLFVAGGLNPLEGT